MTVAAALQRWPDGDRRSRHNLHAAERERLAVFALALRKLGPGAPPLWWVIWHESRLALLAAEGRQLRFEAHGSKLDQLAGEDLPGGRRVSVGDIEGSSDVVVSFVRPADIDDAADFKPGGYTWRHGDRIRTAIRLSRETFQALIALAVCRYGRTADQLERQWMRDP